MSVKLFVNGEGNRHFAIYASTENEDMEINFGK